MAAPSMPKRPPVDAAARTERLLADFDRSWREGLTPRMENFVPPPGTPTWTDAERRRLLGELAHIDLEGRWRLFRKPAPPALPAALAVPRSAAQAAPVAFPAFPLVEDYCRRFPELGTSATVSAELIGSEYFARHHWGDKPTVADYQARFPGRAAELGPVLAEVQAELEREFAQARKTAIAPPPPEVTGGSPASANVSPAETVPPFPRIGRYVLGKRLGAGGFGSVWQAFDSELRREVALKLPRGGSLLNADEEERFLREARAAAGLKHEGIIPVHDVGRDKDTLYIVSELVRGPSLADVIARARPGFRESAALVAQIADALDYAHLQGVVHRDLKPSNILLNGEPRAQSREPEAGRLSALDSSLSAPRIGDFGLAKRGSADITLTLDGHMLGTPAFMSPEQVRDSHQADGRSDIYSLGVILYQLLTGELPFSGTAAMVLEQVRHDEPRRPRRLNQDIPLDLETIALKCMAKESAARYPTAATLAEDLRRWLAGEPIRARPAGPIRRLWTWTRRRPLVASLSAAVLLLLVLVTLVSTSAAVRIGRERDAALAAQKSAEENAEAARQARQRAEDNEKAALAARRQADLDRDRALDAFTGLITIADRQLAQLPGTQQLRGNILQAAIANLERMAAESEKGGARRGVYSAYLALGNLFAGVGQAAETRKYFEKALAVAEETARTQPDTDAIPTDLIGILIRMGEVSQELGELTAARRYYDRARLQGEMVLRRAPKNDAAQMLLAHAYGKLCDVDMDADVAETVLLATADKSRTLMEAVAQNIPRYKAELGLVYLRLAKIASRRNNLALAQSWLDKSYLAYLEHWTTNKHDPRTVIRVADVLFERGLVLRQQKFKEAETQFTEARKLYTGIARGDPYAAQAHRSQAACLNQLSMLHLHGGDPSAARRDAEEAVRILDALATWDPRNQRLKRELAGAAGDQAQVLMYLGLPEGRTLAVRAVRLREEVLAANPKNPLYQAELGLACSKLGGYDMRLQRYADAVPHYRRALELFAQVDVAEAVSEPTMAAARQSIEGFIATCEAMPGVLQDLQAALRQPKERQPMLLLLRATELARSHQVVDALATTAKLKEVIGKDASHHFGLACVYALCAAAPGNAADQAKYRAEASAALQRAADLGFKDLGQITTDPDLASIRSSKEYLELVKRLQAERQ